jgi:hypothetical protein
MPQSLDLFWSHLSQLESLHLYFSTATLPLGPRGRGCWLQLLFLEPKDTTCILDFDTPSSCLLLLDHRRHQG